MDEFEVAVVGGGQAGLAMGQALTARGRRAGTDFVILEASERIGASWSTRWDSLRLFTPAAHSALPGLAFPGPAQAHPGKDDVAAYLRDYATAFDLAVRTGTRVERMTATDDARGRRGLELATSGGAVRARSVVVATGPFQSPAVPALASRWASHVVQVHSSGYRNPTTLPPGRVLVVGAGNSGVQIAAELAATHQVTLAVGTRAVSLPQRIAGRDLFDWLSRTHLMDVTVDSRAGRKLSTREVLVGTRLRDLTAAGVRFTGPVETMPPGSAWAAGSSTSTAPTALQRPWPEASGSFPTPWSGRPATGPTTPGCPPRRSERTARRCTAVGSPRSRDWPCWDCPGCTPEAPRCSAGSDATPPGSPTTCSPERLAPDLQRGWRDMSGRRAAGR